MDEIVFDEQFKSGRFVQIPEVIFKSPALTMQAKCLYALLVSYAWKGTAYPGRERLAKECNVHANTIDKYLKELIDFKLIKMNRRGFGKTNLYELIYLDKEESQETVNQDSQDTVSPNSQTTVLKTYKDKHTKEKVIKDMSKDKPKKRLSNSEISKRNITEAKSGTRSWTDVTDRDFTFYYIDKHNEVMEKPITYDMYSSVMIFRENFINAYKIDRDLVCEFIDAVIILYSTHPNKWQSLTFNMIQKNNMLMNELIGKAQRSLVKEERKFSYNEFSNEQTKNSEGLLF